MSYVMLRQKMEWPEIKRYLKNLKKSFMLEMWSLINKKGGGFTAQIVYFSYVLENSERLLGKEAKGKNEELYFIFKYFPRISSLYSDRKILIWFYEMYRHGLSHRFTPQNFEIAPHRVLVWMVYKGKKRGYSNKQAGLNNITHLRIKRVRKVGESNNWPEDEVFVLPVCINALYNDFIEAFDRYVKDVEREPELQKNFNKWKDNIFYRKIPKYKKRSSETS